MSQNQHSIQKAYYKSFRDGDKIWVYPKLGGPAFRRPISWCTAEGDFQSEILEKAQNTLIENHGIKSIWHLLKPGRIPPDQYETLLGWLALHLTRNQKARAMFFPSNQDYEREFPVEFARQLAGLRSAYTVADVYTCNSPQFLITSDNPIIEFDVECGANSILLLPISPSKLVQLSADGRRWQHEKIRVEECVNAMVFASAFNYIFSHRGDVDMRKCRKAAEQISANPVLESHWFESVF